MLRRRNWSAIGATGILVVAGCLVTGCVADARPPDSPKMGKVISDLSLTLDVRDASGAEEYYTIERDGQFGFGGGMDARFERVTWTTHLSAQELRSLRDLMAANGWFDQQLHSTHQPKNARFEVHASSELGKVHKRIEGENDRIEPVRIALRDIANRRLKMDVDRQPLPTMQRQSTTTQPAATAPPAVGP